MFTFNVTWPSEDAMWLCFSNSLCCTRMHCDDAVSMSPWPVALYHHCKATTMMKQMALKDYWSCHPVGQRKRFSTSRLHVIWFEKHSGPVYQLQSFISLSDVILNGPWMRVLKKLPPLHLALVAKFRDGRNVMVKRDGVRERTHRCSIPSNTVEGSGPPACNLRLIESMCVSQ